MKLVHFLVLIVFIGQSSGYVIAEESISISEGISTIDANFKSNEDLTIIFGDGDELAHFKLVESFFRDNLDKYNIGPSNAGPHVFSFASDFDGVENFENRDLIITGGPCANKFWGQFSEETCDNWPYAPGQSIAKIVEQEDKLVLLLAGTTQGDTLELAEKISNYQSTDLFDNDMVVVINSQADRTRSKSDLCDQEGKDYVLSKFNNKLKYEIEFDTIPYSFMVDNIDFSMDSVDVTINNVRYHDINIGDELHVNDLSLAVCKFGGGLTGDAVTIAFGQEYKFPFYPTSITQFSRKGPQELHIEMGDGEAIIKQDEIIYIKDVVVDMEDKLIDTITINDILYEGVTEGEKIDLASGSSIDIIEIHPAECWGNPEDWMHRPPEDRPCFEGFIETIIN